MRNSAASRPGRPILSLAAALLAAVALAPDARAQTAQRGVEPVVVKGAKLAGWSGPSAVDRLHAVSRRAALTGARDAHNGTLVTPPAHRHPGRRDRRLPLGRLAVRRDPGAGRRDVSLLPLQPELRLRRLLRHRHGAHLRLGRRVVEEDRRAVCSAEYPPGDGPTPDPVPTLDDDDEIVFMASDAGAQAPVGAPEPAGTTRQPGDRRSSIRSTRATLPLRLPLPEARRLVVRRRRTATSTTSRDANADEWIDRYSFARRRSRAARLEQHRLRPEPRRHRLRAAAGARRPRPTASRATASPSRPTPTSGTRPAAGWCASCTSPSRASRASTAPTSSTAGRAARSSRAPTRRSRSSASRTSR